jgi:hypothetical protein
VFSFIKEERCDVVARSAKGLRDVFVYNERNKRLYTHGSYSVKNENTMMKREGHLGKCSFKNVFMSM